MLNQEMFQEKVDKTKRRTYKLPTPLIDRIDKIMESQQLRSVSLRKYRNITHFVEVALDKLCIEEEREIF